VEGVLELVGLAGVAAPRIANLSRGVRQRVAIAGALLGDPQILVLDEPSTGVDSETLRWLRCILREFANAGNSVLLTANSASEMEHTADELVIINEGRMIAQAPVAELLAGAARTGSLRVRTPHAGSLARALALSGRACVHLGYDTVRVHDITSDELGRLALADRINIIEILPEYPDLEQVVAAFVERRVGGVADMAKPRHTSKRPPEWKGMMGPLVDDEFDTLASNETADASEWT
jgi:ABC-2 type transport system ATP-binding protein